MKPKIMLLALLGTLVWNFSLALAAPPVQTEDVSTLAGSSVSVEIVIVSTGYYDIEF